MKTILNNILNANSWLFLELVIITVVAWAVFDPAVVNLYYRSLPLGYDSGQLLFAETEVNGSWDELVDGVPQDPYEMTQERQDITDPTPTPPLEGREAPSGKTNSGQLLYCCLYYCQKFTFPQGTPLKGRFCPLADKIFK